MRVISAAWMLRARHIREGDKFCDALLLRQALVFHIHRLW